MNEQSFGPQVSQLSLPVRLVLAAFLIAVGLGYLSALVQLHFQHASAGQVLPGPEEVIGAYHGHDAISQLESVLTAAENRPFNGTGSMVSAFTTKGGLEGAVNRLVEKKKVDPAAAEASVREERDGERLALVAWIRGGADRDQYEQDQLPLVGNLEKHPITQKYVDEDGDKRFAKIKSILDQRCARCHNENYNGSPGNYPLKSYGDVVVYTKKQQTGGMSLTKLAQSTHVHLLGFSMLWGLTGLAFAFTSYPLWLRVIFSPWVIIAQIADISCWWLGRLEGSGPLFAQCIMLTGGLLAIGLGVQLLGTLIDLFRKGGRLILLIVLLVGALGLGTVYLGVVNPYLLHESAGAIAKP